MFVATFSVEGINELFGNLHRNVGGSNLIRIQTHDDRHTDHGDRVYIYFSECELNTA